MINVVTICLFSWEGVRIMGALHSNAGSIQKPAKVNK